MPFAAALRERRQGPIEGAVAGSAAWAIAHRLRAGRGTVVVHDEVELDRTVRALRYWLPEATVLPYPAEDGEPWDGAPRDPERARARILARVAAKAIVVVVAPALLLKVPELDPLLVERGLRIAPQALLRWLVGHGYLAAQRVDAPGCAALRGDTMSVWPIGAEHPVRIEWFDDEVESPKRPLRLLPAREGRLDAETAENAAAYLHAVASERGVVGSERRRLLSDLREGIWFAGAEDYLPALHPLVDPILPDPVYILEPERVVSAMTHAHDRIHELFEHLDPEDRPLVRPEDRYRAPPVLDGIPVRAGGSERFAGPNAHLRVTGGELAPVVQLLRSAAAKGAAVTLVVDEAARADRIRALLDNHEVKPGEGRAKARTLSLDIGDLPEGFSADDLVFVTADEIFGDKLRTTSVAPSAATKFRKAAIQGLAKLNRGDLVVHARHGIGAYRGLARMPLGEVEGDFVIVEYRDGDKLYVPVAKLELLVPYNSPGEGKPRLDKLGGQSWDLRKAKVRDELLKFAAELLRIHARRAIVPARVYDGRDTLLASFEESFPYVETPDQRAAIDAVLEDLAAGSPMDRLVVGDVGFGKTEIAMRAAFRVAEEGDQVVVLCPTTVLAAQHHANFERRFKDFPIRVELLSRFRTPAESKAVLADLAAGRVDIVIGTHKLLGKGVRFKQLGLVVIDEEHRFGVKQKEDLKRMTAGVHALAMSATPIPRTLHHALSGLRALSIVATPPEGRTPIKTDVVRFSTDRVREDILAELGRDGQVFVVHNRVQSMDGVARWLRRLVPEARIGVAHGQMDADELEKILTRFAHRELDVLLCTAIIESGIDMPTVNTMIVNRAEQFGLAQLYQLRGRIGRGAVRGHCTLLVGGAGQVRREAMERLRALQVHTALGSGFALASQDLEARGGGEILGEKQHGHIAAIGFDAYVQLLEEAVQAARGQHVRAHIEPEIEVAVVAVLPESYVPDAAERLDWYQRLAVAQDLRALAREVQALIEEWGEAPEELRNLVAMTELKLRCRDAGITRLSVLKVRAIVTLHSETRVRPAAVDALIQKHPNRFKRLPSGDVEARFTPDEGQFPLHVAAWVLGKLLGES